MTASRLTLVVALTVGCVGVMQGTSYAVTPQRAVVNRPRSAAAARRTNQLPNSLKHSTPQNATTLRQPSSEKSKSVAKSRLSRNQAVNSPRPLRAPRVAQPTVASLNNLRNPMLNPSLDNGRHRRSNPAVVSGSANRTGNRGTGYGSANLSVANTGSIDGTRMHRRP